MSKDRRQILNMLADGKINAEEAEKLLTAIGDQEETASTESPSDHKSKPRYLRVVVDSAGKGGCCGDQVNVKIPVSLLLAGIKLKALLPEKAQEQVSRAFQEKGIKLDLNDVKPEALDELINGLCDLTVDLNNGEGKVRFCCE